MNLVGSVALVTGANRGLGLAITDALLAAGAARVYAGARDPDAVPARDGVVPVRLDVTDEVQVADLAAALPDVTLVVNNAGVASASGLLDDRAGEDLRAELEVNLLGPLFVSRAFAPVLAANGGGALANVLSIASWIPAPGLGTYATTKAAAWSLTTTLRVQLAEQGTQVVGLHCGFLDTDMTAGIDAPKTAPADVARALVEGIAAGEDLVLADDVTRAAHAAIFSTDGAIA
jgi:NAD(P)-dependent dehydrogenase (short-subunit alcohol dehydrogenase family)